MTRRVLLIGATGLVGRLLVDRLLDGGDAVTALLRRSAGRNHPAWREEVAPSAQWPALAQSAGGDVAISALGTTIRAAGSREAFRAVDLEAVVAFARAAQSAGVRQMIAISSVGADPRSRNFYLRTKSEMEAALAGLGFDRLDLVRPGLLRGEREGERRPGERFGILLSPLADLLLRGRLARYAAIEAETVAAAIVAIVGQEEKGIFIHHNPELDRLARG